LKKMTRAVASRSLDRGLIGVEPNGQNTLIAYAAKAGFTAMDGDGQNSPFALALLKHLTTPGLDIRRSLGQVRDDVLSATGNRQEPYYTGSLGGDDMTLVPAPAALSTTKTADMRGDYELAERVGTKEAWDSFITAYPAGFYSDLAKAQRNKLAADIARQAATDRAHATAEAQTRLAAEGAKASEQAKAAADAKAAEDARLAAEQKKQAEDTRLAQVQQLKAAAQAKADEQVKAVAASEKPRDTVIAALPPAVQAAPPSSAPDPSITRDIPRLLQSELKRVGCNAGEVNGEWNGASRQALGAFNKNAGTHFDIKLASLDALGAVRGKSGRVCPPPDRQHAEHAPAHKSSSGGKCFSFEGSRVCQ
jgi:Caspase domain